MVRSRARLALPVVLAAFVACAVVQVFLAGLGVFSDPRSFITHRDFGYAFGWLTLVALIVALVAGSPRRITGPVALLLLLFALQSVFVAVRADLPAVAALHPLNGFLLLGTAVLATRRAWDARRSPVAIPSDGLEGGRLAPAAEAGR
jgi:hypothetical protein